MTTANDENLIENCNLNKNKDCNLLIKENCEQDLDAIEICTDNNENVNSEKLINVLEQNKEFLVNNLQIKEGKSNVNSLLLDLLEEPKESTSQDDYSLAEIEVKIFEGIHKLIVDTGSEVSVVNQNYLDNVINKNKCKLNLMPAQNVSLVSASGARNKTISKQVLLDVKFCDNVTLPIVFLVVKKLNVDILIGCDALKQYNFKINFETETVEVNEVKLKFCKKSTVKYQNIFNLKIDQDASNEELWEQQINNIRNFLVNEDPEQVNELVSVYNEFSDVFSDQPGLAKNYVCKLNVRGDVKINRKCYPVPQNKVEAVKAEINKMLNDGIIQSDESEFCNPIVVVSKSDGSVRLCLDARQINKFIVREQTSPECIDSILIKFNKCKYINLNIFLSHEISVCLKFMSSKYISVEMIMFIVSKLNF